MTLPSRIFKVFECAQMFRVKAFWTQFKCSLLIFKKLKRFQNLVKAYRKYFTLQFIFMFIVV